MAKDEGTKRNAKDEAQPLRTKASDTTNLRTVPVAAGEDDRETVGVGEAAKLLGLSRPQVRRRLEIGELEGVWRSPWLEPKEDANGNVLRGHRRVFVDSIERYLIRVQQLARSGTQNP